MKKADETEMKAILASPHDWRNRKVEDIRPIWRTCGTSARVWEVLIERDPSQFYDQNLGTETAEVFAVVARYWQGDTFHQRLISVDWLSSSLDAQRQAAHLVQTIMRKFDIDPARIIA